MLANARSLRASGNGYSSSSVRQACCARSLRHLRQAMQPSGGFGVTGFQILPLRPARSIGRPSLPASSPDQSPSHD